MPSEKVFLIGLTFFILMACTGKRYPETYYHQGREQIKTDTVYVFSSRVDTIALAANKDRHE